MAAAVSVVFAFVVVVVGGRRRRRRGGGRLQSFMRGLLPEFNAS